MTTVASRDRDTIEIEPLPEYVREESAYKKEVSNAMPSLNPSSNSTSSEVLKDGNVLLLQLLRQKSSIQMFLKLFGPVCTTILSAPPARPKRGPSFYLTIGFMGGAIVSMLGI